ncbi:MAG: penicillin-binding protein [Solirubrobacteraceae bacterium]|nr:penicillin-binding protein [Solirubrobacteraceae bacterium]
MNAPISRLFGLFVLLFVALVFATSWTTVFKAKPLRDNALNRRELLEQQRIHRGLIRSADGTLLARSVRGQQGTYHRTYPAGGLFAHAIGYSFTNLGQAGLEKTRNDDLTGQRTELTSILDQLRGKVRVGDDVATTLDARAQRVAIQALAGRTGSVVALEPATGAIRVMASTPGFDPNEVPRRFKSLNRQTGAPLLNRATQAGYPPGSTFKVVTAAAAVDSGRFTPTSTLSGKSPIKVSGVPLTNFHNEQFGTIDMTTALTHSVNTYWAQIGEQLGKKTMGEYMDRFGFDARPPLDYPANQRRPSGEFKSSRLLSPESRFVDVGRMAIGQDKLQVTPLQMAMVAATIANGGTLMKPHLASRVIDPDGRTVDTVKPSVQSHVMSGASARAVGEMMSQVVKEGTGTAGALTGIDVAGKTGTAEIDVQRNITQPWFIAFAPAKNPRIAIAVTIERSTGQGGTVAAPVAKQVMESLLR